MSENFVATKECLRFYVYTEFKNGCGIDEIVRKLVNVWGEKSPGRSTIYRWISKFSNSQCDSFSDLPKSGRPSLRDETVVSKIKELIEQNPRLTISALSGIAGLKRETIRNVLHVDLGMSKICSTWVPYNLTNQNKKDRVTCAENILRLFETYSEEQLLHRLIIEDETWVAFHPIISQEDKRVWHKIGSPRPHTAKLSSTLKNTMKKTMALICFSGDKKLHAEGTEQFETVNSDRYVSFLNNAILKFGRDRYPKRITQKNIIWQHDNARPHVSSKTMQLFDKKGISLLKQSAYSLT